MEKQVTTKDVIDILISSENISRNIIKAISKTYGRAFIEQTLDERIKEKKIRHNTNEIITYYKQQLEIYPNMKKKQIRIITALYFNISEKAVQYHITKTN